MEKTDRSKNKKTIGYIFIAIAVLSSCGFQRLFFKPGTLDKALVEAASELNKTCPIMIDQETRLDNAVGLPENIFQYNYTLMNLEKSNVNIDSVRKYVQPRLSSNIISSPDLKRFRDNEVSIAYNYSDKNGAFVLKISITPDMYNKA